jgi:hypothetical protein
MDLGKRIMTILFSQFREQSPWLTADDLRYRLKEGGAGDVSIDILSREIESLKRQGYLELRAVDPALPSRGFITRLTVPGRNLWVHGHSLTGS